MTAQEHYRKLSGCWPRPPTPSLSIRSVPAAKYLVAAAQVHATRRPIRGGSRSVADERRAGRMSAARRTSAAPGG